MITTKLIEEAGTGSLDKEVKKFLKTLKEENFISLQIIPKTKDYISVAVITYKIQTKE